MTTFNASLLNELKKIISRKKYVVFLILEIAASVLVAVIGYALGNASSVPITAEAVLTNLPVKMLPFFIQVYIPLIIFMAACDLYASEVQDGTIRATFMRPVSRFKQYFSKVTAIFIIAVIYLSVLLVSAAAVKIAGTGSASGILENFASYALDAIPLIVLILFAATINQFSKSSSLAIVLCIILYIGISALGIFVPQTSGLLFTGYLQWHNLWLGIMLPFSAMLAKIAILVSYGMIFACVGYYLFERKEV